jgi:outer membrane protein W
MFFLAPRAASAQAKAGDKEVLFAGNLFSLNSPQFTTTSGQILVGIGYFASDRLEVGVRPLITISTQSTQAQSFGFGQTIPASSSTDVDGGVATSAQYYFGQSSSRTKPYLGAQLQLQSFKTKNGGSFADNFFTQALFGVKSYISDRTAFDFSGAYGFRPSAASDFQLLTIQAGFTVLF